MDKSRNNMDKELLACNEELSKELFSKELHIIVADGLEASMEGDAKKAKRK